MMRTDPPSQPLTRRTLTRILASLPWNRYEFHGGFVAITYPRIPGLRELWGVNVFTRDIVIGGVPHRRGDLIMSLNGPRNEPVYYRTRRRLPD